MRLAGVVLALAALFSTPVLLAAQETLQAPSAGQATVESPGIAAAIELLEEEESRFEKVFVYAEFHELSQGQNMRFEVLARPKGVPMLIRIPVEKQSELMHALVMDADERGVPPWRRLAIIKEGENFILSTGMEVGPFDQFQDRHRALVAQVFPDLQR